MPHPGTDLVCLFCLCFTVCTLHRIGLAQIATLKPFASPRTRCADARGSGVASNIHRAFAEAVAWEEGKLRRLGRVDRRRNFLTAFAATLSLEDIVIIEATGNAAAVASVIGPPAGSIQPQEKRLPEEDRQALPARSPAGWLALIIIITSL